MGIVRFDISTSLDGFVAGPDPSLDDPLGVGGEALHEWAYDLKTFKERHGQQGGRTGPDDDLFAELYGSTGAFVMGRNMFGGGPGPWGDEPWEGWWGDEPPFYAPVFVVTHHAREALVKGDTTFTFVTDGVEAAIAQAKAAAGERDVLVSGGADVIGQALAAGLIDEFNVHVAPVILGGGTRLFDGLEPAGLDAQPAVAHMGFRLGG